METTLSHESGIDWIVSVGTVDYPEALERMEARADEIARGTAREAVWLLEHPPLYTAGTSADPADMINARFQVYRAGRGGRYTYHGPGQRIGYLMLDLNARGRDVRRFVNAVEGWMIGALARVEVDARRASGRIGIWADDPDLGEAKIGAIGIRIKRWVSLHGFSINRDPDLSHFNGIVPCGIRDYGTTSISRVGGIADPDAIDDALLKELGGFLARLRQLDGT